MPEETEGGRPSSPPPTPSSSSRPSPSTPPPPLAPGWHADPSGRFDHRYHNGFTWTHDVARDGQRFVDSEDHRHSAPVPPPPAAPTKNPLATTALVLGICSICLAWMPVLFVVGAILAVLALTFGAVGLRRAREHELDRGRAIVGLVTGGIGLACVAFGVMLTVVVYRAIDRWNDPAPHEVTLEECVADPIGDGSNRTWRATGQLINRDARDADFTVEVTASQTGSGDSGHRATVELDDVPAGEAAHFEIIGERVIRFDPVCEVDVFGPKPFGLDIGG